MWRVFASRFVSDRDLVRVEDFATAFPTASAPGGNANGPSAAEHATQQHEEVAKRLALNRSKRAAANATDLKQKNAEFRQKQDERVQQVEMKKRAAAAEYARLKEQKRQQQNQQRQQRRQSLLSLVPTVTASAANEATKSATLKEKGRLRTTKTRSIGNAKGGQQLQKTLAADVAVPTSSHTAVPVSSRRASSGSEGGRRSSASAAAVINKSLASAPGDDGVIGAAEISLRRVPRTTEAEVALAAVARPQSAPGSDSDDPDVHATFALTAVPNRKADHADAVRGASASSQQPEAEGRARRKSDEPEHRKMHTKVSPQRAPNRVRQKERQTDPLPPPPPGTFIPAQQQHDPEPLALGCGQTPAGSVPAPSQKSCKAQYNNVQIVLHAKSTKKKHRLRKVQQRLLQEVTARVRSYRSEVRDQLRKILSAAETSYGDARCQEQLKLTSLTHQMQEWRRIRMVGLRNDKSFLIPLVK